MKKMRKECKTKQVKITQNTCAMTVSLTVKPDVLLMGTLQTSAATLIFDWQFEWSKLESAWASCYRFRAIFKYHLKSSSRIEILYLVMAKVHYNRTTTLERREKIIALWTSGSKQAQIAEEVGLSPQIPSKGDVFPWKAGLEGTNSFYPWRCWICGIL